MRTIILILSAGLMSINSYCQIDTIAYQTFNDTAEYGELRLHSDNSFLLLKSIRKFRRGYYMVHGKWETKDDKILLTDTIKWMEDWSHVKPTRIDRDDTIRITIRDEHGYPLKGIKVNYNLVWYCCDYASFVTNDSGQISIGKELLRKQKLTGNNALMDNNGNVKIVIDFPLESRVGISTSGYSAPEDDHIEVILVLNPKTEKILRKTIYKVVGSEIHFVGQVVSNEKGELKNWGNFRKFIGKSRFYY